MPETHFVSEPYSSEITDGNFAWRSPSNIALVKYWGKRDNQIPENPSISFTLDACRTTTTLEFKKLNLPQSDFSFEVFLDNQLKEDFKPKINAFFLRTETYLPFLKEYHFKIHTSNTFPHSSGIAS